MARKANTIGKYAAENGNAPTLMASEKASCDYSRSATGSVQESHGGCGQTASTNASLNLQSTLQPGNAIILLHI